MYLAAQEERLQQWLDSAGQLCHEDQAHDQYGDVASDTTSSTTEDFQMSDHGSVSSASQTSYVLSKRPTLTPSSPSKRQSAGKRSPSPTRKLLTLLATARPPVRVCQPGTQVGQTPQMVTDLRRSLSHNNGVHVIPEALKVALKDIDDEFDDIPSHMFDPTITMSTPDIEGLFKQVRDIYLQAERCNNHHKDENAWVEVVRSVLKISNMGRPDDMIEINSVQTQAINSDLLPILPDSISPLAKKADLTLAFNPYHPKVSTLWWEVQRRHPGICLSQMSDAYTSLLVLPCGMEVKETGGDMNEALLQLAVWTAAGLEKLWSSISTDEVREMLPLLGITVVGHEWRIHVSWKIPSTGETVRSIS